MSILIKQLFAAVVFLGLVLFAMNPMHMSMSIGFWWIVAVAALIAFSLFVLFIWREAPRDEREMQHAQMAGRIGFLVGSGALVLGILYQAHAGQIDWWLLAALAAMVFGKWISAWYSQNYL